MLTLHERSDKCSVLEYKQVESSKSLYERDSVQTFSGSVNNTTYLPDGLKCFICGKNDHTMKSEFKMVDYFSCAEFVNMEPAKRYLTVQKKGLYAKCLWPGAKFGSKHNCSDKYACMHDVHMVHKPHVLVCNFRKKEPNLDMFESYKRNIIWKVPSLPWCSKNIGLSSGSNGANVASTFRSFKSKSGGN